MSDILADYREWRSPHEERIGTHGPRCHLWHERCFVHRLARELERTRAALVAVATQDGTLSVSEGSVTVTMDATLTDAEREALVRAWHGLLKLAHHEPSSIDKHLACARVLNALLERMKNG